MGAWFLFELAWDFAGRSWHSLVLHGLAFVLGIVALLRCRERLAILTVVVFVVPPLVLALFRPKHFLDTRYLLYLLPLYLVVIAAGLESASSRIWRRAPSKAGRGRVFAVAAVVFIVVSLAPGSSITAWLAADDWNDVAEYLEEHVQAGEAIYAHPGVKSPVMLRRYVGQDLSTTRFLKGRLPWTNARALLRENPDRVWVVRRMSHPTKREDWVLSSLEPLSLEVFQMTNATVSVYSFQPDELAAVVSASARRVRPR